MWVNEGFIGVFIAAIIIAMIACCNCIDTRTPVEKVADEISKQEEIVETRYKWYMSELSKLEQMKEVAAADGV